GDGNLNASQSAVLSFTVGKAATTTTLSASQATIGQGQSVTLFGAAWPTPPGAGDVSGAMTFFIDGQPANVGIPAGQNYATLTLGNLAIGNHVITASYAGDGHFTGSSSSSIIVTVVDPSGAAQLFASVAPANGPAPGQAFTIFAQAF